MRDIDVFSKNWKRLQIYYFKKEETMKKKFGLVWNDKAYWRDDDGVLYIHPFIAIPTIILAVVVAVVICW